MCRLISFNKAALAGLTGCCWLWLGEAISLRLLSSACWSTSTSRCAMASSTAMRFWASALSMQSMLYWSLWWAAEVRDSRKATISSATMSRSSSGAAPLIWSRVNNSAWPLSWVLGREVGGGDDRTGVGGVGVRIEVLLGGAGGTCEEGGGVMEDEGGFGDWYLSRSLLAAALWFEAVSCEGWRGLATGCRRSSCDMASSSWATDSRWSMTMRRQTGRDNAACASGELELVGRTREVAGRTRVMIGGAPGGGWSGNSRTRGLGTRPKGDATGDTGRHNTSTGVQQEKRRPEAAGGRAMLEDGSGDGGVVLNARRLAQRADGGEAVGSWPATLAAAWRTRA